MVRTVRVLVLTAAALAFVSSCNLGVSIFPARLTSYEGYADLSGYIDPDRVYGFEFQIIRNSRAGTEYLVLVNDDRSFDGVHLVVYDANLDVLGKFTLAQLDAMGTGATFTGRNALVDASDMIVVGNRRFTVGPRGLVYKDTPTVVPGYNGLAIPEATVPPNLHNFRAGGASIIYLNYDTSPRDWTTSTGYGATVGSGTAGKFVGAWMQDAFVYVMIYRNTTDTQIFKVPRTDFANGTLSAMEATYSSASVPVPTSSTAWQTLGFTYDGTTASFAVYCWRDTAGDTNRYVRFSVDGVVLDTSEVIPEYERPYEQRHVYGRESGWYIFDPRRMTVERCAWWWK